MPGKARRRHPKLPSWSTWTDEKTAVMVGTLLRVGVLVSAAVVLIGGVVFLFNYGLLHPDYTIFRGGPPDLSSVSGIATDALALHGRGVIQLGILMLIATPVARVALSLYAFLRQRDALYSVVTAIVLGFLLFSLSGGYH